MTTANLIEVTTTNGVNARQVVEAGPTILIDIDEDATVRYSIKNQRWAGCSCDKSNCCHPKLAEGVLAEVRQLLAEAEFRQILDEGTQVPDRRSSSSQRPKRKRRGPTGSENWRQGTGRLPTFRS